MSPDPVKKTVGEIKKWGSVQFSMRKTITTMIRGKIKRNGLNNTERKKRERGDLIIIYKLMNNFEETDRKDIILTKGEDRYLRTQEKIANRNLLEQYKKEI